MPRARITREMIVEAAFGLTREQGAESVNARTVAAALRCSTQPILYYFSTIEEMKRAVYEKTDRFHTAYLLGGFAGADAGTGLSAGDAVGAPLSAPAHAYTEEAGENSEEKNEDALLGIGLSYIRFAVEEPHLFRFLFQSGFAAEHSVAEMLNAEALSPILAVMQPAMGVSMAEAKEIFGTIALFAHGYASLIANNAFAFDEAAAAAQLERVYRGAAWAAQEGAV